jgi:hypothetical protein
MTNYSGTWRRNRVSVTLVLGLTAWLGFEATGGWAADSIRFTEALNDRVVCVTNQNGVAQCGPVGFGRFTIDAKVSFAGVNISQFGPQTFVYLSVGDSTIFSGSLGGSNSNYVAGKKRATIVQSHVEAGRSKPVVDLQVGLTWNWKELRIHTMGNPSAHYLVPVFCDQVVEAGPVNGTSSAAISFGNTMGLFDVTVVGSAKEKSVATTNGVVNLLNVKIKGKGTPAGF